MQGKALLLGGYGLLVVFTLLLCMPWPRGYVRTFGSMRSQVRFPGQVMILGRNDTDGLDKRVKGPIARADLVSQ